MVWGYESFYILLCQCVRINKLWDKRTKLWGNHVGILFVVPDFLMSTEQVLLYMYSLVNGFISTNYNWKALTGSCFYCPLFHQTSKSTFIVPYSIMCIVFLISNSCFNSYYFFGILSLFCTYKCLFIPATHPKSRLLSKRITAAVIWFFLMSFILSLSCLISDIIYTISF